MAEKIELLAKLRSAGVPVDDNLSVSSLKNLLRKAVEPAAPEETVPTEDSQTEVNLDKQLLLADKQLELKALEREILVLKAQNTQTIDLTSLDAVAPKFTGSSGEDVNRWLEEVQKLFNSLEYGDKSKFIALRHLLRGQARRFTEAMGAYTYEETAELLKKEYGRESVKREVNAKLRSRVIQPNEGMVNYVREMQILAATAQMDEVAFVEVVIMGARRQVTSELLYEVETLRQLKEAAEKIDRNHALQVDRQGGSAASTVTRGSEANTSGVTMSEVRCYNCFRYGHYQSSCTEAIRPRNSCFVCQEVGHTRHECPTRVAAGREGPAAQGENRVPTKNYVSVYVKELNICKRVYAFFDTGSTASFINGTVLGTRGRTQRSRGSRFRGIGNKMLNILGKVRCEISFRGETWVHNFYILDPKEEQVELIIGEDLLNEMNIYLTKGKNIELLRNETLSLSRNEILSLSRNEILSLNTGIQNNHHGCCEKFNLCRGIREGQRRSKPKVARKKVQFSSPEVSGSEPEIVAKVLCSEPETEAEVLCSEPEIVEKASCSEPEIVENASCSEPEIMSEEEIWLTKEEVLGITGNQDYTEEKGEKEPEVNEELEQEHISKIKTLIGRYQCTKKERGNVGKEYAMRIKLTSDTPVVFGPRKLSYHQRQEAEKLIDEMLKAGTIRHSDSPYASPIVLTKKKNGQTRLCVDYRALNKITVKDHIPLPLIEDCLTYLGGKKYFTTLELTNGFHQVPMEEESIKLTAFVTPMGQYEYCYMPFGLANAPPVFQRFISSVLRQLIRGNKIVVYLDDIIIATKTMEEHITILTEVLTLLSEAGLSLNLNKCRFAFLKLQYLGYGVSEQGITPNDEHLKAICDYKVPDSAKEVQKAIGLFSYFRRFVPNFSRVARPLQELVNKNGAFEWSNECAEAFQTLKAKLIEPPVLAIFHPSRETELHTDASSKGYGAVLLQKQDDKKFHPVAYFSKTTTDAESRYHSFELETLAIVNALERFRQFLEGMHFVIVTDCSALVMTMEKKLINPRIARWTLGLADFDFMVRHRKGEQMQHVDALSRSPVAVIIDENEVDRNIQVVQTSDPEVVKIRQKLEEGEVQGFLLENGLVFKTDDLGQKLYVPKDMENSVMRLVHENYGHQGVDKCENQSRKHYWFPRIREKLNVFIKNCLRCIYYSGLPRGNQRNLHSIEKKPVPFDTIHIDHFGPLEAVNSKHRHILAVVDSFTKFVKLYAVNTGAKETVCSLKKYFTCYSRPRRIISDRGTCFTSGEFREFCEENNIGHILNSVASPQSNGQVERVNRVIKAMLAKLTEPMEHRDWVDKLSEVKFAINNTVHTATKETPSKLLFGVEQRGLIVDELTEYLEETYGRDTEDLTTRRKKAEEAIIRAQLVNEKNFEKTHTEAVQFEIGDLVVIKNVDVTVGKNKKLIPKYKGPYVVQKQFGHDRYLVTDVENCQITQMPYSGVVDSTRMKKWLSICPGTNSETDDTGLDLSNECVNYEYLDDAETEVIEGDQMSG